MESKAREIAAQYEEIWRRISELIVKRKFPRGSIPIYLRFVKLVKEIDQLLFEVMASEHKKFRD